MLGLPPATLRTWEERYGVVCPSRTAAGHRLYSRDQVEQLRFVKSEIERGKSAADAHRLLARRFRPRGGASGSPEAMRPQVLVLIAERDRYSAELVEFFIRTEGFGVAVALDVEDAKRMFRERRPDVSVVELLLDGGTGENLCRWLKEHGSAPVLAVSTLDVRDRALEAGADAFVTKPLARQRPASPVRRGGPVNERLPTGAPGLDQVLDSGLPAAAINLILGLPGTGKTLLALQCVFRTGPKMPERNQLAEPPKDGETPADAGASEDGRGWFRTSDLSRVKRALSH